MTKADSSEKVDKSDKKVYSNSYLDNLCKKIGVTDEKEKRVFKERIIYAGNRYKELTRINANRIRPHQQEKILSSYKEALLETQKIYKKIHKYGTTSGKLAKAIRKKYEETSEPGMKEMFFPYFDGKSTAVTLFDKFLGLLAEAAEDAKNQNIGNDKADLSGEFFTGWITAIGKSRPKSAAVKFTLGKHDKEAKIYTSQAIPILHDILSKVDSNISEKEIENALRKIKKNRLLNQPLAIFLIA